MDLGFRLPDDLKTGMRDVVASIDLNKDTRQRLGRRGVLDRARVPPGHAGFFSELDYFISRRAFIPGHKNVALDLDFLF